MSTFQPIMYVPVEIVRHHKVFYEFYACPHATKQNRGGKKREVIKKSQGLLFLLLGKK